MPHWKIFFFYIFELQTGIPYNFGKTILHIKVSDVEKTHIWTCSHLNQSNSLIQYNKLLNGNVEEKISVAKLFRTNLMQLYKNLEEEEEKKTPGLRLL